MKEEFEKKYENLEKKIIEKLEKNNEKLEKKNEQLEKKIIEELEKNYKELKKMYSKLEMKNNIKSYLLVFFLSIFIFYLSSFFI